MEYSRVTSAARTAKPFFPSAHQVFIGGFYSNDWDFTVRSLLGKASRGGAEVGEVLSTIAGVRQRDAEAWFRAWVAAGERVAAIAAASAVLGHRVSAARASLRAANYLAAAFNAIDGSRASDRLLPVFRAHRAAWDSFLDHTPWPVERVQIPYEGSSMPGWLFRPDSSGAARATLVMNNGSDGSVSGLWCEGAEGALERGYNVLLFDGPGQQSMLFERAIPFRHDWEAVLSPVVDFLVARGDVDAAQLAVYGISQAGYWVPRALAFERRFTAAIVDGGVVDVSRSWFAHIPRPLLALYENGEKGKFERDMEFGLELPGGRAIAATWSFRARPYGTHGFSATLDEVAKYTIKDVAARIETPLLILDPEDEQFFPGQSAELAALVRGAELVRFTAAEGANFHCQPMARELTEQRMFDWLDEKLAAAASA